MVRAPAWTEAELEIVRGNPGLPPADLAALLPGRSNSQMRSGDPNFDVNDLCLRFT